jgi:hypothetical protein
MSGKEKIYHSNCSEIDDKEAIDICEERLCDCVETAFFNAGYQECKKDMLKINGE